jgi:hypothetical protein
VGHFFVSVKAWQTEARLSFPILFPGGNFMRKCSLATVVALAALFAPPLASEARAQSLPVILQQTVNLPAYGASQDVTITLTAGVTYYFCCNLWAATGYSMPYDSVLYLYSPSGTLVASNDDWGGGTWNSQLGPTPTNGYGSYFAYTAATTGTYRLNVASYNWGASAGTPSPFALIVYGTSSGSTPPTPVPTTGIPNVRLDLRPSPFDLPQSPSIQENRFVLA